MGFKKLEISGFKGLDTQRGDYGKDASGSPDALNFTCGNGVMETFGGVQAITPELPTDGCRLFQAFFREEASGGDRRMLMASGGGALYALEDGAWHTIGSGLTSDEWEAVNYRKEDSERILMVNGADGMLAWDGKAEQAEEIKTVQGGEPIVFSHLTLLYERLWGAVHPQAPDRLYWSESFSPDDWEVNYDTPETGGGFVDVATFDGTRIRAIEAAFDDVLIFKDKSMHRLNGSYPGEFNLTQVYGSEGTLAPRSIVHTADRLYFLGMDGLCVYNGMSVSTLSHAGDKRLDGLWERLNRERVKDACAAIFRDTLYLALPLDGAQENSHVLEYRLSDGCSSLIGLAGVKDFLVAREETEEKLICLVGRRVLEYGQGGTLGGEAIEARWTSPVLTLDTLTARRTAGRMCMTVIAADMGGGTGMRLSLESERGSRSREVPLKEGMNLVRQRVRIRGRTLRFRIESMYGCRLTLPAGMELLMEEDSDL